MVEGHAGVLVVPQQRHRVAEGGVGAVVVLETAFLVVEEFDGGEPVEAVVERHHQGEAAVEAELVVAGHLVAINLRAIDARDDRTDKTLCLNILCGQ